MGNQAFVGVLGFSMVSQGFPRVPKVFWGLRVSTFLKIIYFFVIFESKCGEVAPIRPRTAPYGSPRRSGAVPTPPGTQTVGFWMFFLVFQVFKEKSRTNI